MIGAKHNEKAKDLIDEYRTWIIFADKHKFNSSEIVDYLSIKCALLAIEKEYHSLREMLFNLRACRVIESEKVYLRRLQELIDEEEKVKQEIEKY
jgi:hypothetical protein